ncbi:ATP-binding protein [Phytohabitans houttuyneae]|uniref:ATP-binding protein n=1 Tax=Phytohabitans houttuyneae TaxID=1076126 RepID=UPI001C4989BD|nr:ATP-binding protein [Phytohabitans houttuyneae]
MSIVVCLPREVESLRVARGVLGAALAALEVTGSCREQLAVVVSEACGNVVAHADGAHAYVLKVNIAAGRCDVKVVDQGGGFVYDAQTPRVQPTAASGRGLYLIDLLTDQLTVTSDLGHGTTVSFTKRLDFTGTPRG